VTGTNTCFGPTGAGVAPDLVLVLGDGLSSLGVQQHAPALLDALREALAEAPGAPLRLGPLVLVQQARVAVADEVGERLGTRMVAMVLGERPGLSSPDSLGIYLTASPRVGCSDAQRNCISNVRPAGQQPATAARRLVWLGGLNGGGLGPGRPDGRRAGRLVKLDCLFRCSIEFRLTMLDHRQLEAFNAVVEHGSFRAAAAALSLTLAAVSLRIKSLEESLGQRLLVRGKAVRATAAGQALLAHVRQVRLMEADLLGGLQGGGEAAAAWQSLSVAINADSAAGWFLHGAAVAQRCRSSRGAVSVHQLLAQPAIIFNRKDALQDAFLLQHFGLKQPNYPRHYAPAVDAFETAIELGLGWGMVPEQHLARRPGLQELLPGATVDVTLYWQHWTREPLSAQRLTQAVKAAAHATLPPVSAG